MLSSKYPDVIATGYIKEREKLAEYYNVADVFVNLTHADTLPTVNMESICCGTPVVTYDSCGSPELVDNNSGIVVKEYDEEGIIDAIMQVKKKKHVECSIVGKQLFDKNQCYEKYIDLYIDLLKPKRA